VLKDDRPLGLQVLIELHAVPCASKDARQRCLRRSSGSRLRSSPLSSMMANAHMWRRYLMRSNSAMPSSPQATASPSTMHERERRRASASNDLWEGACEVVAGAAVQLDALVLFPRDDPDPVVLDFAHHWVAGGSGWGCGGKAGRDEPGW
jgi:hypothetical protein